MEQIGRADLGKDSEVHRFSRIPFLIVVTLFTVVATSPSSGASSHKDKARPSSDDGVFRKLGINKVADTTAPDFTLRDIQGNSVSLRHFGGKVVFLNFWATWCGPCRNEMPSMERLYRRLKDRGLVMLAVDKREGKNQVAKFMKDLQLTFPALLDIDGTVFSLYRVTGLPTTYLIDHRGKIVGRKAGSRDWATPEVEEFFDRLLKEGELPGPYQDLSVASVPPLALPSVLIAKSSGVYLYAHQDGHAERVGKLERGDQLSPLGKTSSEGEVWYLVKTQKGAIGWIRSSDVEERTRSGP